MDPSALIAGFLGAAAAPPPPTLAAPTASASIAASAVAISTTTAADDDATSGAAASPSSTSHGPSGLSIIEAKEGDVGSSSTVAAKTSSSSFSATSSSSSPEQQHRDALTPSDAAILLGAGGTGICVKDNFLGDAFARGLVAECGAMDDGGQLGGAGMSGGVLKWTDGMVRGDRIKWITSAMQGSVPPHLGAFLKRMRRLGAELADRDPSLGLGDRISVQLACYPGQGERYVRHLDRRKTGPSTPLSGGLSTVVGGGGLSGGEGTEYRQMTALYYLNDGWEAAHGGCLRAFLPRATAGARRSECGAGDGGAEGKGEGGEVEWDVEPRLDHLLLFRSDVVEHEVNMFEGWGMCPGHQCDWETSGFGNLMM